MLPTATGIDVTVTARSVAVMEQGRSTTPSGETVAAPGEKSMLPSFANGLNAQRKPPSGSARS